MLKFSPPKVEYKKPRVKTVLAFLQSLDWKIDKETERFYVMRPPDEKKSEEEGGFRYYVPANEVAITYNESAFRLTETFAELYEFPLQELFDLLSQSLEEIQREVEHYPKRLEVRKAILSHAS